MNLIENLGFGVECENCECLTCIKNDELECNNCSKCNGCRGYSKWKMNCKNYNECKNADESIKIVLGNINS